MLDPVLLALAPVVLAAYAVGTATGFGSAILTLALGVHLAPLTRLVPDVVILNVVYGAWLFARHRRHVDLRRLLGEVLPLMGLGLPVGLALPLPPPASRSEE